MYRIVQFDDEGEYYAFVFDETTQELRDENNDVIPLEFETEEEAREYAMENCMNNNFNVGWRIEKL